MIINWYGILFGNGLEIRKQPKLERDKIRETILSVEKNDLGENRNETARIYFPDNVINFVEKSDLIEGIKDCIRSISHDTWQRIEAVINNSDPRNSIEKFFMDVESQVSNTREKAALKEVFLRYINMCSLETKIDNKEEKIWRGNKTVLSKTNDLLRKTQGNDSILTTNYTNFIERHGIDKNKITYLHGEYNNPENPPLLGLTKFKNISNVVIQSMKNIEEKFNRNKFANPEESINLNLSIFGWSPSEEYELIWVIIFKVLQITKGNFFFHKKINWNSSSSDRVKEQIRNEQIALYLNQLHLKYPNQGIDANQIDEWKVNIIYYYFIEDDKKNFKAFLKQSSFFTVKDEDDEEISGVLNVGFRKLVDSYAIVMCEPQEWFLNGRGNNGNVQVKELNCTIKIRKAEDFWGKKISSKNIPLQEASI